MAPGEAVELGGCRNNSLAAINAPGVTLDGARDVCVVVCCRATCTTAVPGKGGWEPATWRKQPLPLPQTLPRSWYGAQ
jgi:hypothetical protein